MSSINLGAGVTGLAGVFSQCLQCFELFENAELSKQGFDDLLLMLDCQRERLMIWGELVGMLQAGEADKDPDSLAEGSLSSVISLLSNAKQLKENYGVQLSSTPGGRSKLTKRLGSDRLKRLQDALRSLGLTDKNISNETGPLLAIHDKTKFETLILTIEKLVTELHGLVPIEERSQTKMVYSDVALLEISELRSVERVCEGRYPSWADAASAIIMATEAGTTKADPKGELKGHIAPDLSVDGNDPMGKQTRTVFTPKSQVTLGLDTAALNQRYYFMFTDNCFNQHADSKCHVTNFGDLCVETQEVGSVTAFTAPWGADVTASASKRIVDSMQIKFTGDQLKILRHLETKDTHRPMVLQTMLPLATFYVYCGPCAFAIRSAIHFCNEHKDSAHVKCLVRIDDRINTSCCADSSKMARFASVLETIKELETGKGNGRGFIKTWLRFIDRVWLEQRMNKLEEEETIETTTTGVLDQPPIDPVDAAKELFQGFSADSNYNGFVILGEAVHCGWMLQAEPFPSMSRPPRETEIYQIHYGYNNPKGRIWQRTYLGTYTPRDYLALKTKKNKAALTDGQSDKGPDGLNVKSPGDKKPAGSKKSTSGKKSTGSKQSTNSTLVAQDGASEELLNSPSEKEWEKVNRTSEATVDA